MRLLLRQRTGARVWDAGAAHISSELKLAVLPSEHVQRCTAVPHRENKERQREEFDRGLHVFHRILLAAIPSEETFNGNKERKRCDPKMNLLCMKRFMLESLT